MVHIMLLLKVAIMLLSPQKYLISIEIEISAIVLHSMAMGNLKKSKETTQTATTASKVAP